MVLAVLIVVGVLRLVWLLGHLGLYLALRNGVAGLARALAGLGLAIPIAGAAFAASGVAQILRESPRLGWRVLVEVPVFVGLTAAFEAMLSAVAVAGILIVHRIGGARVR